MIIKIWSKKDNKHFDCIIDDEDFNLVSGYNWFMGNGGRGYAIANINKGNNKWTTLSMSRLIMRATAGSIIDHINHNTVDNRKSNLRVCSRRENSLNRLTYKKKTAKYKGVTIEKYSGGRGKEFARARIRVDGKLIHLGCFKTQESAAIAYDTAAKKYFGEFAHTNF